MKVWLTGWEWECCGAPFSVGATVEWNLTPVAPEEAEALAQPLGDELGRAITHTETHHGPGELPSPLRVRVDSIHAVYWDHAPRPDENPKVVHPVAGSAHLQRLDVADPQADSEANGNRFAGYLVDVRRL